MNPNICSCPKSPSNVSFYIPAPWWANLGFRDPHLWKLPPWYPMVYSCAAFTNQLVLGGFCAGVVTLITWDVETGWETWGGSTRNFT
jgi:hypothetical protein